MRIGDEDSFVEFKFKEAGAGKSLGRNDLALSVEVACNGFSGSVERIWFSGDDRNRFLAELQMLMQTRQGSATLLNMSSASDFNPLHFEILAAGLGLSINVALLKIAYPDSELRPLRLAVSFPFDAGMLSAALLEFRKLFESRR